MKEGSELLHTPGTRLMCNACGVVSSRHRMGMPFEYKYTVPLGKNNTFTHGPYYACHHYCIRCGNDDDTGIGFLDSGNYECDETRDISKWEKELDELKSEVEDLEHRIKKGKARWAELWETDEDAT
ncbi:MAG: hypothetical protein [Caudoviricetes sp.]|nr:MAG: hypothetical protein [Caudoviricetes sp.]